MEDRADGNNRRDKRCVVALKVDYRVDGSFVTDYSRNLARRGLFISTSQPLPVGEQLRIRLPRSDGEGPFALDGVVRWQRLTLEGSRRPAGMGVEFVDMNDETKELIHQLLEKLDMSEST
ncbi:MAG: TIGR02266 family protein [Myxococcales bacterium]|nr:TIGR02266 family protein [Myxococcales bacterium]